MLEVGHPATDDDNMEQVKGKTTHVCLLKPILGWKSLIIKSYIVVSTGGDKQSQFNTNIVLIFTHARLYANKNSLVFWDIHKTESFDSLAKPPCVSVKMSLWT